MLRHGRSHRRRRPPPRTGQHAGPRPRARRHLRRAPVADRRGAGRRPNSPKHVKARAVKPELMRPIRLVLVDDHAILRQGLRAVLERDDDLVIVGEAVVGGRGRGDRAGHRPRRGAARSQAVRRLGVRGTVVVRQAVRCATPDRAAGADDIPRRGPGGARGARGCARLRRQGRRHHRAGARDPRHLRRARARSTRAAPPRWCGRCPAASESRQQLTDREIEVLRLLAAGLSNNKIGEKLYISATTAKFHVSNILRKLEVSRRAEAVYAASKRGLI